MPILVIIIKLGFFSAFFVWNGSMLFGPSGLSVLALIICLALNDRRNVRHDSDEAKIVILRKSHERHVHLSITVFLLYLPFYCDKYLYPPFENLSALPRGGWVFIRRWDKIGLDPEKT